MSSPGLDPTLAEQVAAWRAQDPDPATRAELDRLAAAARAGEGSAAAELAAAFAGPLTFGTAGLRGRLGPGPARMNRVVVAQAAAGLGRYLLDDAGAGLDATVAIGYDARHGSDAFARDTAELLAGLGLRPLLFDRALPTPLLAFAVKQLGCAAGVMVTASHNPREDNGYKVYLGDGRQIVPPADAGISARIAEVAAGSVADLPRSGDHATLGADVVEDYLARALETVAPTATDLAFVYTPLHGVGGAVVPELLRRAGFGAVPVAPRQADPDPDFPTAAFPNPEEAGALDPAYGYADELGVDLVLANDPDADRCAVAVRRGDSRGPNGGWQRLSGDQLGLLLGEDALRRGARGTVASSIVSSTALRAVAAAYGQPFVATLTGFKWIARAPGLVFGYEEALGYCCDPEAVADKDGMTALLRVAVLAAELAAAGLTLDDRLDELDRTYGVHATDQLAVRVSDLSLISDAMARLRAHPPTSLAGEPVSVTDLAAGSPDLPPTDGVLLAGETVQVVARPSGTEPKLKCYLEVRAAPTDALAEIRTATRARLTQVRTEMAAVLGV